MRLALTKVGIGLQRHQSGDARRRAAKARAQPINGRSGFHHRQRRRKLQGEKNGLKVIIDMAKLKVPFQFNCSVATRKKIRENPDEVRRVVWALGRSGPLLQNA